MSNLEYHPICLGHPIRVGEDDYWRPVFAGDGAWRAYNNPLLREELRRYYEYEEIRSRTDPSPNPHLVEIAKGARAVRWNGVN